LQRIYVMLAIGGAVFLVLPHQSSAQEDLVDGIWSGTMTQPADGPALTLEYHVTHHDGRLEISIATPMGRFPFSDVSLSGGALQFTWQPGPLIECQLESRHDGGYEGACVDGSGATGRLLMLPPNQVR
jgi:hypothetical protein